MAEIRLIATDLDGTIIGGVSDFHLYDDFRDKLVEYRKKFNTIWVTCTGRSLRSTKEFLSPMELLGIRPDYIIVNHAYIFERTRFGYMPHVLWNLRIRYILLSNRYEVQNAMEHWGSILMGSSFGVSIMYKSKNRLRMRFNTEQSAAAAEKLLSDRTKQFRHIKVFKQEKELDVFQLPFTKGLAISELARHLGMDAPDILAVGDGHNDISMLERSVAESVGCPSNAFAEVKEVIHENGGHIAHFPSMAGVLEIMDAYLTGKVDSSLPVDWQPPQIRPYNTRNKTPALSPERSLFSFILFGVVVLTVILTVASFNVIPFSWVIMAPFKLLIKIIEKIIGLFI